MEKGLHTQFQQMPFTHWPTQTTHFDDVQPSMDGPDFSCLIQSPRLEFGEVLWTAVVGEPLLRGLSPRGALGGGTAWVKTWGLA